MTPTVSIDMTEFNAAMRQYLARTKSTLEEATNRRLFFVLARAFVLLKPHNANTERARIREYLNQPRGDVRMDKRTGKKVGRGRVFRLVHKIAVHRAIMEGGSTPWKGRDRFAGAEAMSDAAAKVRRQSIGSVGYLKSVVAKAIKLIRGSFRQYGRQTKKAGGKSIQGNAAVIGFAEYYGVSKDNVGMHKGAKAYVLKAKPGFSPYAVADMAVAIKDGQDGNVGAAFFPAFTKAFNDERIELEAHLASVMQADANDYMEKPL